MSDEMKRLEDLALTVFLSRRLKVEETRDLMREIIEAVLPEILKPSVATREVTRLHSTIENAVDQFCETRRTEILGEVNER